MPAPLPRPIPVPLVLLLAFNVEKDAQLDRMLESVADMPRGD